ncbi:chloramphenicol phosphotransferase CPT family protein [Pacificoceanicola onchidii]|uniref:chloramphenicol phosphotransferase CPT family protein n=1 Tax=Pacificoceanicola onchidii TaxID=2562685 RepID=UPI0010A37468|nr:chloramphenicol phosphotransferase [Pacificoceanicola onchidii]
MSGQIIILHGPSSSGKSTLARAIREAAEVPLWHVSIDHLRGSGALPAARFDWATLRGPVFDGFHRSLAAYAEAGNNLIVEHILDTPHWAPELKGLLRPFDVLFVGVFCGLEDLKTREAARGDRPVGSAEQDYHTVHKGRVYDLRINTDREPTAKSAERVLAAWRSGRRCSEFAGA